MKLIRLFVLVINFCICCSVLATAQEVYCAFRFKDGSVVNGKIRGIFTYDDSRFRIKNLDTDSKENIESEDLKEIVYIYEGDSTIFTLMTKKHFSLRKKLKSIRGKLWVGKVCGIDKMEGYIYFVRNNLGTGSSTMTGQAIRFLPDDFVYDMGIVSFGSSIVVGSRKAFNVKLKAYAEYSCPSYADNIGDKTYNAGDLDQVIKDYAEQCK